MGRPLRIQADDVVYHVTTRGVRRLWVYEDAFDFRKFEALLARVVLEREWEAFTYCQMPNHYHLLLRTPDADISDGMCWLNGVYARWFNRRHGYSGHVFEERFHTELVLSDAHLLATARYIPRNPVRAGLCANPAEWRWSAYRATIGRVSKPWLSPALLGSFGRDEVRAVRAYRQYVELEASA